MAFDTYADLQAAVASWLQKSILTSQIPDFIRLFEASWNRKMRTSEMETVTTLTPGSDGTVALPSGYLEARRVTVQSSPVRDLKRVGILEFQDLYPDQESGFAAVYTIEALTLKVAPIEETEVEALLHRPPRPGLEHGQLALNQPSRHLPLRLAPAGQPVPQGPRPGSRLEEPV